MVTVAARWVSRQAVAVSDLSEDNFTVCEAADQVSLVTPGDVLPINSNLLLCSRLG